MEGQLRNMALGGFLKNNQICKKKRSKYKKH
jgi:hypothetical protein